MAETTWRWVTEPKHGDPDDCNNVLVERTRNDAMGMTSTVDRVILRCGNIDAEDRDLIGAALRMRRELMAADEYLKQWAGWDELGINGCKLLGSIRATLAAARGEEVPDASL